MLGKDLQLRDSAPYGTFSGANIITPDVVGYARGYFRGGVVWMELTTGKGFIGDRDYFGVAFRRPGGGALFFEPEGLEGDPSRMFTSRAEALDFMAGFCDPQPAAGQ